MKTMNALAVMIYMQLATGCAQFAENYEADPILGTHSELLGDSGKKVDTTILKSRIADVNGDATKRNSLLVELIAVSNRVCAGHQSEIIANANTWNIATGTITNLLSGLGAVVGGATTKSALAAGAAFSSGTRSLVNEEVYVQSLATTIVRAIDAARQKKYADIERGLQESKYGDYPLEQGLLDIQEYHRRCSFYVGVMEVAQSIENRKQSKAEIEGEMAALKESINSLRALNIGTTELEEKLKGLAADRVDAPQ